MQRVPLHRGAGSAGGGYKYNSKSDARYMNRHRRVENVDLAVGLCTLNQVDSYPITYSLSNP
jgi:hypothetical protein